MCLSLAQWDRRGLKPYQAVLRHVCVALTCVFVRWYCDRDTAGHESWEGWSHHHTDQVVLVAMFFDLCVCHCQGHSRTGEVWSHHQAVLQKGSGRWSFIMGCTVLCTSVDKAWSEQQVMYKLTKNKHYQTTKLDTVHYNTYQYTFVLVLQQFSFSVSPDCMYTHRHIYYKFCMCEHSLWWMILFVQGFTFASDVEMQTVQVLKFIH